MSEQEQGTRSTTPLNEAAATPAGAAVVGQGGSEALAIVEKIRAQVPAWQRSLQAGVAEANASAPDWEKLKQLLDDEDAEIGAAATELSDKDGDLLGTHADFLVRALRAAAKWWASAQQAVEASNPSGVRSSAQLALAGLDAALQHTLFLTFVDDVRNSRVGEGRGIVEYCQGWGLNSAQISMVWLWLSSDPLRFGGEDLPIALDTVNQRAYRKADDTLGLIWRAAAPLWGYLAVFVVVAALFELLHAAGITTWPGKWVWKMLVLILFVTTGSALHLGSRTLNINYDNPMRIYDAGNILSWLSLRWVAVVYMYLPITFVVIGLWGAGNIPSSFQKLGTAILAGYSADSLLRAALSKLQAPHGSKQPTPSSTNAVPTTPTAASTGG